MFEHVFVCATGYYTHISTLADVQENVMEYLHVLSRPMVINHDHDIIWTEAYMDSVVSWLLSLWVCLLGSTQLEDLIKMSDSLKTPVLLLLAVIQCTVILNIQMPSIFLSLWKHSQQVCLSLCLSPWYWNIQNLSIPNTIQSSSSHIEPRNAL